MYEMKPVVCDYGIYQNGELKLILSNRRIAEAVLLLLETDENEHALFNSMLHGEVG